MPPVGATIFGELASIWNEEDVGLLQGPFSILFSLDRSGSMGINNRLTDLKTAVTAIMEDLKAFLPGAAVDIGITMWSDTSDLDHRHDVDAADVDSLIAFMGAFGASGGTVFTAAVDGVADFYTNSTDPDAVRIFIFLTDGQAVPSDADDAADTLFAVENLRSFCFNIDEEDITQTAKLDNTPEDGIPVLQDGDPAIIQTAIENVFEVGTTRIPPTVLFNVEPDTVVQFFAEEQSAVWAPSNALRVPTELAAVQIGGGVSLSWVDNNAGDANEEGFFIYRDTFPLDVENLPAPLADLAADTITYLDETVDANVTYHYRVAAHREDEIAVSSEVSIEVAEDFDSAQVGDEIGGGIYAGKIIYADAREFHIVSAKQAGEQASLTWRDDNSNTGIRDVDDGVANTDAIIALGTPAPAFDHCVAFTGGGFTDWYLPAENELLLVYNNLVTISHPEFTTNLSGLRWASTEDYEGSTISARFVRFSDGVNGRNAKLNSNVARPIRRVAA